MKLRYLVFLRQRGPGSTAGVGKELLGRCDFGALRAALLLRDELGGSLSAVCIGPKKEHFASMNYALDQGADRAVCIGTESPANFDSIAVSMILAAAARQLGYNYVLCGDNSEEGVHGGIGPAAAAFLGVPHLSGILEVGSEEGRPLLSIRSEGSLFGLRAPKRAVLAIRDSGDPAEASAEKTGSTTQHRDLVELSLSDISVDGSALEPRRFDSDCFMNSRTSRRSLELRSVEALAERLREERLL